MKKKTLVKVLNLFFVSILPLRIDKIEKIKWINIKINRLTDFTNYFIIFLFVAHTHTTLQFERSRFFLCL